MKIASITPLVSRNNFSVAKKVEQKTTATNVSEVNLNNLPNYSLINFGYTKRKVQNGDLTPYERAGRLNPNAHIPQEEQKKFDLSVIAEKQIEEENYLEALKTKISIASICQDLGQTRDAYLLEVTIRELYAALPKYQREEARKAITSYNFDMGKYIDDDIKKLG